MLSKNYISIEFGERNIKFVTAAYSNKQVKVTHLFSLVMPEGVYEGGKLKDPQKLENELKSFLRLHNIKNHAAIISLNNVSFITREVLLPESKPEELASMVQYEIQQLMPVEISQYVLQFKNLESVNDAGITKQRLMVAALLKQQVEMYLDLVKNLGLKPIALDMGFNGVSQMLDKASRINDDPELDDRTVALLDIGDSYITVSVLKEGSHRFSRTVDNGSHDITITIADALGVSSAEAEIIKYKLSNFNEADEDALKDNMVEDAVRMIIDTWIFKIRRVFQFYESRNAGKRVEAVYMYGGGSNQGGLAPYFEKAFDIPTAQIHSISSIALPEGTDQNQISFYLNTIGAVVGHR